MYICIYIHLYVYICIKSYHRQQATFTRCYSPAKAYTFTHPPDLPPATLPPKKNVHTYIYKCK